MTHLKVMEGICGRQTDRRYIDRGR